MRDPTRGLIWMAALLLSGVIAGAQTPASVRPASSRPSAAREGALLGLVTDAAGSPQANALVEVRGQGLHGVLLQLHTSPSGVFSLPSLMPGTYYVEVAKGARMAERRKVEIHASERALLLVNLPQVLRSAQWGPPSGVKPDAAFAWALRQATIWRPILRLEPGNTAAPAAESEGAAAKPVQGYVALTAGGASNAFAMPDFATEFRFETPVGERLLSFSGDVGSNGIAGLGDTRVQATLRSQDESQPGRISVAVRQIAIPGRPALPSLRVASVNLADGMQIGDRLRLQYGAMLNGVSMTSTVDTINPYFQAVYRVGQQGQLAYRAVSAVPPVVFNRNFADMPDPTPEVTLSGNQARLEQAQHQELQYSDSLTPNDTVAAAVFTEHFQGAAVDGANADGAELKSNNLLPDLFNNMFTANGGNYGGWGYRLAYGRRLGSGWQAEFGFTDGMVLAPQTHAFSASLADALTPARAHAWTVKVSGELPLTHTGLVCSYRDLSRPAVTGLDLYDNGLGQSSSFANVTLRQPLPRLLADNGRLALLVEINNLLAQGYVPMMGSDGHTLYLVQSARSLRGGLSFNF